MRSEIKARVHTVGSGSDIAQHRPRKDVVGIVFFAAVVDSKTIFIFVKYDFVKLSRCYAKVLKEVCLQNSSNNAHKDVG